MERPHILSDLIMQQFGAHASEPWPDDAALFQPQETEQSLLYEYAESLSVRAFLKMCDLPFHVEMRSNAEYMSPSGKVPFLKAGKAVVAEFEQIVEFVALKGVKLSDVFSESETADMQATISLVQDILLKAEVTKPRYSSVYTWPLNAILPWQREIEMRNRLEAFEWAQKTLDEVLAEINECCKALSVKLGNNNFFAVDRPTELDALVFGHLFTILTTELPDVDLASIVKQYQNLVSFCQRIEQQFFFHRKELAGRL